MKRLLAYLKPYKFQLLIIGVLMVGNTLARLAGPYLLQRGIDEHISPGHIRRIKYDCDFLRSRTDWRVRI